MAKAKENMCQDCGVKHPKRLISSKCIDFNNLTVTECVFITLATFLSVTTGVLYATTLMLA